MSKTGALKKTSKKVVTSTPTRQAPACNISTISEIPTSQRDPTRKKGRGPSDISTSSKISTMSRVDPTRKKGGGPSDKIRVTRKYQMDLAYNRLLLAQSCECLLNKSQSDKRMDMKAQSTSLARVLTDATEEFLELGRVEREESLMQNELQALMLLEDVLTPIVEAAAEMKEVAHVLGSALQVHQNQLKTKGFADFSSDMEEIQAAFTEVTSTLTELCKLNLEHEAPYQQAAQALNSIEESGHNIRNILPTLEKEVVTLNKLVKANAYATFVCASFKTSDTNKH